MFWSLQGRRYSVYGGFFSITLNKLKSAVTNTSSPSLQFVLTVAPRDLYIYKDFAVRELLDRVIYETLYGNPLDFSKMYDIVMNDEIKLIYLLFSVYLSPITRGTYNL